MLIKNATLCDVNGETVTDIIIEDGVITQIGKNLNSGDIIDATGCYFMPSLRETNIRLQDSTLNAKNIEAISKKALKGGVGHLILNADSTPPIDDEIVLEFAQHSLSKISDAKIELMLNSLKADATLSDIAILLKKGVVAPYMSTTAKNNLAIRIAEYVKMYDVTLFCKAEDNSLINSGVMLEGDISSKLGLAGIPNLSEVLHVSRMIEIARHFNIKILFKSIASPRSISLITQAKQDGVRVSCEVSINHLTICDEACEKFNTTAKLDPPLASKEDVVKLQTALKNGEIDILTSLHQPSSVVNKEVAFYDAKNGCESIEEILSLYYTKLVKSNLISMSKLVELTSKNPAKSIKVDAGTISVGDICDAILFNPHVEVEVDNNQSLYNKEKLNGKVTMNFQGKKITTF